MSEYAYLIAGFFLPLFPLSMVFNALFNRVRNATLRSGMLLAWPQLGLGLLYMANQKVPAWIMVWAVLTSLLYGLRALALREVGLWICFIATSAWGLLWIPIHQQAELAQLRIFGLGFSVPLILLVLLGRGLERRFGAAYTGLHGGLAQTLPRFSGVLVVVVLAVVATPLFPAFFTMLDMVIEAAPVAPAVAVIVALVWLLWSWAGARLIQGLIVGPPGERQAADLSVGATWVYAAALILLAFGGIYLAGVIL